MAEYTISIRIFEGKMHVVVSRDGKFFDEAEFTIDEVKEFIAHMTFIAATIASDALLVRH